MSVGGPFVWRMWIEALRYATCKAERIASAGGFQLGHGGKSTVICPFLGAEWLRILLWFYIELEQEHRSSVSPNRYEYRLSFPDPPSGMVWLLRDGASP